MKRLSIRDTFDALVAATGRIPDDDECAAVSKYSRSGQTCAAYDRLDNYTKSLIDAIERCETRARWSKTADRRYAEVAYVQHWGRAKSARRVAGLLKHERAVIRAGGRLYLRLCPPAGPSHETDREIIARGQRFYTRLPAE